MGCGGSTTAVQTFQPPAENNTHSNQSPNNTQNSNQVTHQQKQTRQASAASIRSNRSQNSRKYENRSPEQKITKPSSAGSSKSNKSRRTVSRQSQNETDVVPIKPSSASSRKSINTLNERADTPNEIEHENQSEDDVERIDTRYKTKNKQGLVVSGDPFGDSDKDNVKESRSERHERRALEIEEIRAQDFEGRSEQFYENLLLTPLDIQGMDQSEEKPDYTIDDVVEHNDEVGSKDWFKYGRKIYSWGTMKHIVENRINEFRKVQSSSEFWYMPPESYQTYPIYLARRQGVSRKELKLVLSACLVGNLVDLPRDIILAKMSRDVDAVLEVEDNEDGEETEDVTNYKSQCTRWKEEYPHVDTENKVPDSDVDPNEQPFPLPKAIMNDPSVLRQWSESWEPFDLSIPDEGAWKSIPLLNDDFGDANELFAKSLSEREDGDIPEMDTKVDGEAAWTIIELDIFKTDTTTEVQDFIWVLREKRRNLNDKEWMSQRRRQLGDMLVSRHEMNPMIMEPYTSFYDNLEIDWNKFLELCEKDFVRPGKYSTDVDQMPDDENKTQEPEVLEIHDETDRLETPTSNIDNDNTNALVLADTDANFNNQPSQQAHDRNEALVMETMDSGLEFDSSEQFEEYGTAEQKTQDDVPENKEQVITEKDDTRDTLTVNEPNEESSDSEVLNLAETMRNTDGSPDSLTKDDSGDQNVEQDETDKKELMMIHLRQTT